MAFGQQELLASWRRSGRRSNPRVIDADYLVHCRLAALFGDHAPRPFRSLWDGQRVTVTAYSAFDAMALLDIAEDARVSAAWRPLALASEPLRLTAGRLLEFTTRVCPVVRQASAAKGRSAGAEVDAYLRAVETGAVAGDEGDEHQRREQVYSAWLGERLQGAGARLVQANLKRFRLSRMLRRSQRKPGQGRRPCWLWRPDAELGGRLEVEDPTTLATRLHHGIGRHHTFGFGLVGLSVPAATIPSIVPFRERGEAP